jgi:hypothetical protein
MIDGSECVSKLVPPPNKELIILVLPFGIGNPIEDANSASKPTRSSGQARQIDYFVGMMMLRIRL